MFDLAIVGFGPAGALLLAQLPDAWLAPERTLVVDAAFNGGDLPALWGAIAANTSAGSLRDALRSVPRFAGEPLPLLDAYDKDAFPQLADVGETVRRLGAPLLRRVTAACAVVDRVQVVAAPAAAAAGQQPAPPTWRLHVTDSACGSAAAAGRAPPFEARRVVLCTGATCRSLDLPLRSLPLEVALDPARLARALPKPATGPAGPAGPAPHVVVFGTSHSGTLVLDHLRQVGARATAVHRGARPFSFARDGDPDGIKAGAAFVADAILARSGAFGADKGAAANPRLVKSDDTGAVLRALLTADAVVSCTGFRRRAPPLLDAAGEPVDASAYDAGTGRIAAAAPLFGFGAGWPSLCPTKPGVHENGIAHFVRHVGACVGGVTA
jgi:hypothetical protein